MITTVVGDDSFAVSFFVKKAVSDFEAKYGKLSVEKYDLEENDLQSIFDAIFNFSLLSEDKLVVIRGIDRDKEFAEKLLEKVDSIPDTTDLLLFGGKPDKRAKSYKDLKKSTEFKEFSQSAERDMPGWVVEKAKECGGEISRSDAVYLIDRVGQGKMNLINEIQKLVIYNPKISRDSVNELTVPTPQSTIFQLIDAAFAGNIKKAFELYDEQKAQKVEPMAVVGMIAWQLQILTVLVMNKKKDQSEIAKAAKISPFVISKNMPLAMRLSRADIKEIIEKAVDLDKTLKNSPVSGDSAVKQFLLELKTIIS
ncbi:MAG: DNA polymerase III subunit delta [bacterium]|nr:DNA polymerase III subunit delta [bacterium]